jgi:hypothetical protein
LKTARQKEKKRFTIRLIEGFGKWVMRKLAGKKSQFIQKKEVRPVNNYPLEKNNRTAIIISI